MKTQERKSSYRRKVAEEEGWRCLGEFSLFFASKILKLCVQSSCRMASPVCSGSLWTLRSRADTLRHGEEAKEPLRAKHTGGSCLCVRACFVRVCVCVRARLEGWTRLRVMHAAVE